MICEQENVFELTQWCTDNAIENTPEKRLACLVEEVGEVAGALLIESGCKNKPLKESSKEEAVDCIITALSLYYALGGTNSHLIEYMGKKLGGWRDRINSRQGCVVVTDRDSQNTELLITNDGDIIEDFEQSLDLK